VSKFSKYCVPDDGEGNSCEDSGLRTENLRSLRSLAVFISPCLYAPPSTWRGVLPRAAGGHYRGGYSRDLFATRWCGTYSIALSHGREYKAPARFGQGRGTSS